MSIIIIMTIIIFLNFIIAEATNSYQKVQESLESSIQKEKADLIFESEFMSPKFIMNETRFPKFIIIRKIV